MTPVLLLRKPTIFVLPREKFRKSLVALGEKAPSEKRARTALSLATVLLEKHNCADATTSAQEAMVFFESKWNPSKSSSSLDQSGPNFLNSLLILARCLNCQKRYGEALPLLERAHTLQKNIIMPVKFDHELTDALRIAFVKTGNKQAAGQLHEEIRSTESTLKESDVSRLSYREALKEGKSAHQGGNFSAAEKLLKQAVRMAKAGGNGEDTLQMAEAMLNLGDVYSQQSKYSQAGPLLERALAAARKHLDRDDRRLKDYLKRLASFYANNSQWKKSRSFGRRSAAAHFSRGVQEREKSTSLKRLDGCAD